MSSLHNSALFRGSLVRPRECILRSANFTQVIVQLNHLVDEIHEVEISDSFQCEIEELPLLFWCDVWDDEDEPGVQGCPTIESKEMGAIVRNECVIVLKDEFHQAPVLEPAHPDVIHVISYISG
jgi:hypothetical protein